MGAQGFQSEASEDTVKICSGSILTLQPTPECLNLVLEQSLKARKCFVPAGISSSALQNHNMLICELVIFPGLFVWREVSFLSEAIKYVQPSTVTQGYHRVCLADICFVNYERISESRESTELTRTIVVENIKFLM